MLSDGCVVSRKAGILFIRLSLCLKLIPEAICYMQDTFICLVEVTTKLEKHGVRNLLKSNISNCSCIDPGDNNV